MSWTRLASGIRTHERAGGLVDCNLRLASASTPAYVDGNAGGQSPVSLRRRRLQVGTVPFGTVHNNAFR